MKTNPIKWGLSIAAASLLLSSIAFAKVSVSQQDSVTTYKIRVDDVAFRSVEKNGQTYTSAKLLGVEGYEAIHYEPGSPEIPVIRFYVEGSVEVLVANKKKDWTNKNAAPLVPAQPSRVKLPIESAPFVKNADVYQAKSLLPALTHTVEEAGSVRGVKRKLVTLYPLRYAAGDSRYVLVQDFVVKATQQKDVASTRPETFLFVVSESFVDSPSLAAYEALKTRQGFLVERLVVTDTDTPETIRSSLQDVYGATNLQYALIIGDSQFVPAKSATNISGVTDHYYRAIDTADYESDINGPDIGVGRVSVRSEEQLAIVLAKYSKYSQGQFADNTWLNGAAFLATDDRYTVAEGSHNYAIDTYTTRQGYRGVFPGTDEAGGDKLYAITHRVSSERANEVMQMGRTIINYSGHGATTFWDAPRMTQADVKALSDQNATAFVISNACITGQFTVDESFGETWQRHGSGAVMFWGSMDNTYWDEDDILERRMYDGIYALGKSTFRDITQHALSQHWAHYGGDGKAKYYWETYVSLGDPSLTLRTAYQQVPTLSGPEVLPIGMGTASYKVAGSDGLAVAGARVALSARDGNFVSAGVTDATGEVTFDIASAASGPMTFDINVSGQNLVMADAELQIIPSDSPYLAFADYYYNDRKESSVYAGEEVVLQFTVTNFGQRPTTGSMVTLTNIEGPATLIGTSTAIPAMAGRDVFEVNSDDLRFVTAEDAADGDVITVTMIWETNEGQSAEVIAYATVQKASLEIVGIDFGASTDDIGIAPGATGEIYLSVKNIGGEAIANGLLVASPGKCVSALEGEVAMVSLAAGETLRLEPALSVTVDGTCENGDTVSFTTDVTYESVAAQVTLSAEGGFTAGIQVTEETTNNDIGLAIPDAADAVTHDLVWEPSGLIADVGVTIAITHSYVGDLTVELVHPDGTAIMLHNKDGGAISDLNHTYGLRGDAVAAMATLMGKRAEGTWKLRVQDHAGSDTGTLNSVTLKIKGYFQ